MGLELLQQGVGDDDVPAGRPVDKDEQQKPGGGDTNPLILWRRGCINSKIDPQNIGL